MKKFPIARSLNIYVATTEWGWGVFAAVEIKKGATIEMSPFIKISHKDTPHMLKTSLANYAFGAESGSVIGTGCTSLYNHSDKPNAEVELAQNILIVSATQKIKPDEQIFIDYGWSKAKKKQEGIK